MRTLRQDELDEELEEPEEQEERPVPSGGGLFPRGPQWELTQERAWRWFEHNFSGMRGDSRLMQHLGPLDRSELALLLWDLDCYRGLCERYLRGRGPQPPPLERYLEGYVTDPETGQVEECRQQWGIVARVIREIWGDPE